MRDFCRGYPMVNRVFAQIGRLDAVMAVVGADRFLAVRLDKGMSWPEARATCVTCVASDRCAAWLAMRPRTPVDDAPAFCPNRSFFLRCRKSADN